LKVKVLDRSINKSVMLPTELLIQMQNFIEGKKQLGYATKEELIGDAIRFRLALLKGRHKEAKKWERKINKNESNIIKQPCVNAGL